MSKAGRSQERGENTKTSPSSSRSRSPQEWRRAPFRPDFRTVLTQSSPPHRLTRWLWDRPASYRWHSPSPARTGGCSGPTGEQLPLLCFVVPVVLASAFGVIFHRPGPDAARARVPVLVVVEDDGPFTRRVADGLLAADRFNARAAGLREAEAAVAERCAVAVVLAVGFERVKRWPPAAPMRAAVRLLHHPNATAECQVVEGVVTETVMKRLTREAPARPRATPPCRSGPRPRRWRRSPGAVQLLLAQLLRDGAAVPAVLGHGERPAPAPRAATERVGAHPGRGRPPGVRDRGQSAGHRIHSLLQVLVTFGVGYLVFGVTIDGSVLGFALLAVSACGLAAATGLLVAALGGTEPRVQRQRPRDPRGVDARRAVGAGVPVARLGGDVSLAVPTTWAMRGLETVTWQGGGFLAALPSAAAVAGFALALLAVATVRLKCTENAVRNGRA